MSLLGNKACFCLALVDPAQKFSQMVVPGTFISLVTLFWPMRLEEKSVQDGTVGNRLLLQRFLT